MHNCETITLHRGPLAFTAHSLGEGPTVLFVHGFPDSADTWQYQLSAAAKAGYRAVAVQCRGYEEASQPADGSYRLADLADDVAAWLDELGVETAHLVGHDWGAAIAIVAAAKHPQRIRSLCAMAVPHAGRFDKALARSIKQLWLSRYMVMFQIPNFAEYMLAKNDYAYIDTLWQRWSPGWDYDIGLTQAVRRQLAEPGVRAAALSYYRQAFDKKSTAGRESLALGQQPVPVRTLGMHGQQDGCINSDIFKACMLPEDFPGGLEVQCIENAGHFMHLEQPDAVNKILVEWLNR